MNEENNPNKIVLRLQVKLDAIADKKVRETINNAMKPLWDLVRNYNIGEAWTDLKSKGGSSVDLSYALHHAEETIIRALTPRFREAEVSDFCTQISELSGKAEELKGMLEGMESR